MKTQYTITTVPHNLSKEDTICQIVELLDYLDQITEDIFSKVNKRIEADKDRLLSLSNRVEVAATQVEKLKGDKKAKTVFSSSKYPAVDVNKNYTSIFAEPSTIEKVRYFVKQRNYVSTYEPMSKLHFYHVKLSNQKEVCPSRGLGPIPEDTTYINDLLYTNSGKNAYREPLSADTLQTYEVGLKTEVYSISDLEPAPLSISQRSSSFQSPIVDNYAYTPKIELLPALDVPSDLPDLPGVADDVRYELDNGSTLLDPPLEANKKQLETLDLPAFPVQETTEETMELPPSIPEPPIMIPPPPPIEVPKAFEVEEPKITEQELPTASTTPAQIVPQQMDARASLMDAIRKAGGSLGLKKTSDHQTANEQSKNRQVAPKGDLMADLHSKLMMRRKGISGVKQNNEESGFDSPANALSKLSSLIPPPTKNNNVGSEQSTEEDDEEWND